MNSHDPLLPDAAVCESFFGGALGLPFVFGTASGDGHHPALSPAEKERCTSLGSVPRMEDWLRARSALKSVLSRLGEDTDTSAIRFPNPRFSLSHCGRAAVAVGIGTGALLRGLGVDLEHGRTPPETSERFFLSDIEKSRLPGADPDRGIALRRLWTAKEAIYKADPDNGRRLLIDYRLEDPTTSIGRAMKGDLVFEVASLAFQDGELSVSILRLAFSNVETRA